MQPENENNVNETVMSGAAEVSQTSQVPQMESMMVQRVTDVNGEKDKKEGSKMSKKQIVGLVVLTLIAIGGVLFGVYGMNSQNEQISELTVRATNAEGKVTELTTDKVTITEPSGEVVEIEDADVGMNYQNPVISGNESESYDVTYHIPVYIQGSSVENNDVYFYVRDGKLIQCSISNIQDGECSVSGVPDGIYKMATIYEGNGMGDEKIGFLMSDGSVYYAPIYSEADVSLSINKSFMAKKANIDGFVKDIVSINYCSAATKYCNASTVFLMGDSSIVKYNDSMFE